MRAGTTVGIPVLFKTGAGALTDPDEAPKADVYKGTIKTTIIPTLVKADVGIYSCNVAIPDTWEIGDILHLKVSAKIDGYNVDYFFKAGEVTVSAKGNTPGSTEPAMGFTDGIQEDVVRGRVAQGEFFVSGNTGDLESPPTSVRISEILDKDSNPVVVKGAYISVANSSVNAAYIGKYKLNVPTKDFAVGDSLIVTVKAFVDGQELSAQKRFNLVAY